MSMNIIKASAGSPGGTKAWIKCFDVTKDLRLLALGIINCHLLRSLLNFLDKKMKRMSKSLWSLDIFSLCLIDIKE